jgi:hypothetical protein
MDAAQLPRQLWRSYIGLFIANELDLVYTYFGLGQGSFLEGNPWLRPHLLTWYPITIKAVGLAALAVGIVAVLQVGVPRQRRVLWALQTATAVYAGVLVLHLINLLDSLSRG